ncbi:MAG: DHH family phosphoesterase [Nanoarchaeota archaeon]|nr:DHH family phosphoesterase [Nanoarchaeota archaeon]
MEETLKKTVDKFIELSKNKEILIISHHDTDGITSAAIIARALERQDLSFSIKILKQLEEPTIDKLPEDKILVFLDLGSSHIESLSKLNTETFIIDHHEVDIKKIPENIFIINPHLIDKEEISASGLTYLFVKNLNDNNKDLASLGVIGLVGDFLSQNISKHANELIKDSEVKIKRGLLIYPATRPINKSLEYSTSMFIPGVTGNPNGVFEILQEAGITKGNKPYKSIIELTQEENSKLITGILLRRMKKDNEDIIGNIYLVKFFNKLEDARELSALINACGRLDSPETAIGFCLGNKDCRKRAEEIYASYKQHLIAGLNSIEKLQKIQGKGYLIVNAQDKIKDTIIGTVASILSNSSVYDEGTILIAMAYSKDKIKVSARLTGRKGRNLKEILNIVTNKIGGECGGHSMAAGAIIEKEKGAEFIEAIRKTLDIETVKV